MEIEVKHDEYHSLTTSPTQAEKLNRPATDPGPMKRMITHHLKKASKSVTVSKTTAPAEELGPGLAQASPGAEGASQSPPAGEPEHSKPSQESPDPDRWAMKILEKHNSSGVQWVETGFSALKYGSASHKKQLVEKKLREQGFSEYAVNALYGKMNKFTRAESLSIIVALICRFNRCRIPANIPTALMDPSISKDMLLARLELLAPSLTAEIYNNRRLIQAMKMPLGKPVEAALPEAERPGLNYESYPSRRPSHLPPVPSSPAAHQQERTVVSRSVKSRLGQRQAEGDFSNSGTYQQNLPRAGQESRSPAKVKSHPRERLCARDDSYWDNRRPGRRDEEEVSRSSKSQSGSRRYEEDHYPSNSRHRRDQRDSRDDRRRRN